MEIFEFIFSSFWTWLGMLILIYTPCVCFSAAISSRKLQKAEPKQEPVKCRFEVYDAGKWAAGEGEFLCWGSDFFEFEAGPGNYTVALIKRPDGQVVKALPEKVKFGG